MWHMTDHDRKDSDRPVQLSASAAPEPEIESRFYELRKGKVWFSEEIKREQRKRKTSLWRYIHQSRFFVALTAALIYACIIAFLLLDLFVTIYQAFSFPIYGIPKILRDSLNVATVSVTTYCSAAILADKF
jgi:hypothetical protein